MIPGDIGDVPTLHSLNKPQKRALILRDQLRYLEPAHLDTFLNGVTADEPPTYRNINGVVHPPLTQVTIKKDATSFDLGNVQFPEEGRGTFRTFLTVEDGRFEMRTEDPLPKDDAELGSVSIHRFVAQNMFPLFEAKYKAIYARMEKINEARRVAYNMLDHPPAKFEEGETLARLQLAKSKANENGDGSSRKRKEVVRHISNKRQRVGLETIPDNVKSEIFDTIPTQIKANLFNSIVRTAFPNFDNLIVASWNVVSIYANIGSDFPELHKAVVELKGALEEFESAYASPCSKSGKGQQSNTTGSRTATPVPTPSRVARSIPAPVAQSITAPVSQPQEDNSVSEQRSSDEEDSQEQMLPPRILQPSQQQLRDHDVKNGEHQAEPSVPTNTGHMRARSQSVLRLMPENVMTTSRLTPYPTPDEQYLHPPRDRTRKVRDHSAGPPSTPSHLQAPGAELMRKRQEYASSISKTNRSSTGAALGQHTQADDDDEHFDSESAYEQRRPPGNGVQEAYLGASVLGAKKPGGLAPVAPMLHTRKGGGGANGGNGAGRRGYPSGL